MDRNARIYNGDLIDFNTGEVLISIDKLRETLDSAELLETDDGSLAVGVSFPSTMTKPTDYLSKLDEWTFAKQDIYKKMEVCHKMYTYEGIVGSVIDTMVDIANTPLIIQDAKNKEVEKIINYFINNLNKMVKTVVPGTKGFIERSMTQWLVLGNVFPYKTWKKIKIDDKILEFPNIVNLNPQSITVDDTQVQFGKQVLYFNAENARSSMRGITLSNSKPLPEANVDHLKRKANDWESHGIPYLIRAFSPVASKKRLRRLDDATTEGLINYLTIFKIGSKDEKSPYHKVSTTRLQAFASLISSPNASTTLIWPHDLEVETVGPDGKVLDFKDKYAEVDEDILKALGIGARIFTEMSEEAVLVFVETLEAMREVLISYIRNVMIETFERNGIDAGDFKLKFTNVRLSDILQKLKSLVLSYYDRGLLSYETALTLGGHNFAQEAARKKKEIKVKEEGLFAVPNLPFSTNSNESPMQSRDDGRPEDKVRTEKTKIDNDMSDPKRTKDKANLSVGDNAFIEKYRDALYGKYEKLTSRVNDFFSKSEGTFDEVEFDLIMAAAFVDIKKFSARALEIIYDNYNEEYELDQHDIMFQRLEGWNVHHLDKFQQSLSSKIKKFVNDLGVFSAELVLPVVAAIMDRESYRFKMYSAEGFYKAQMAGTIEHQAKSGFAGGYWETSGDERVCTTCAEKEGNWYTNDEIFDIYPSHPQCRCTVSWTKNNPLIDEAGNNNTVVRVAPDKPNTPL